MKKLIIFVLTTFLTFTIFLSSKSANAEITPVTPLYGGDILNGKELYLFQNYSATPNFENGYISKKTISQQDVYYQENSFYNGWYKDLGRELIDIFTEPEHEPENPYFWFYIPLDNMTAQYLQLALIMPEPYESDFYVKFKNETPINFLTTNGDGDYLITPPTSNMLKEIEWICYSVYYQDYLASFRPLTAEIAYNFGFYAGESAGYDRGYNTGYSNGYTNGHTDGYNEGSIDTQYGVNTVVDFNQLIKNGNFENNTYWYNSGFYATNYVYSNNQVQLTPIYEGVEIAQALSLNNTHKYFLSFYAKCSINLSLYVRVSNDNDHYTQRITTDFNRYTLLFENPRNSILFYSTTITGNEYILLKNIMIFDLTQIYGIGNEPSTIDTILYDFPSDYYSYSTSTLINIDYQNGYIKGEKEGYATGYEKGKDAQATQQLTSTGWISGIFEGISSLLNIQILPGVTIGIIVGIPFIISLAYFVIRAFRGGGGD